MLTGCIYNLTVTVIPHVYSNMSYGDTSDSLQWHLLDNSTVLSITHHSWTNVHSKSPHTHTIIILNKCLQRSESDLVYSNWNPPSAILYRLLFTVHVICHMLCFMYGIGWLAIILELYTRGWSWQDWFQWLNKHNQKWDVTRNACLTWFTSKRAVQPL